MRNTSFAAGRVRSSTYRFRKIWLALLLALLAGVWWPVFLLNFSANTVADSLARGVLVSCGYWVPLVALNWMLTRPLIPEFRTALWSRLYGCNTILFIFSQFVVLVNQFKTFSQLDAMFALFVCILAGGIAGLIWHRFVDAKLRWIAFCAMVGGISGSIACIVAGAVGNMLPSWAISGVAMSAGVITWNGIAGIWIAQFLNTLSRQSDPSLYTEGERLIRRKQEQRAKYPWLNHVAYIAISILTVYAFARQAIQNCGWLDIAIQRSGCYRSFVTKDITLFDMAFSPNDELLAVTMSDYKTDLRGIRLYHVTDGSTALQVTASNYVDGVVFSPDGSMFAGANYDRSQVYIWRTTNGDLLRMLPTTAENLTFSRDSQQLLADQRIWRVRDGVLLSTLPEHAALPTAFTPSGRGGFNVLAPNGKIRAVSGSLEGTSLHSHDLELRRPSDNALIRAIPDSAGDMRIIFSPDSRFVAGWYYFDLEDTVRVWDVASGKLVQTYTLDTSIDEVAWTNDSTTLALCTSYRDSIQFYRVR